MAVSAGLQTPPRRQATIGHDQLSAGAGHRHIDAAVLSRTSSLFSSRPGQALPLSPASRPYHTRQRDFPDPWPRLVSTPGRQLTSGGDLGDRALSVGRPPCSASRRMGNERRLVLQDKEMSRTRSAAQYSGNLVRDLRTLTLRTVHVQESRGL
jgi:hypothetical protein